MKFAAKGASQIASILKEKKVKQVVICPGSRNAPLIIAFTADPYFHCFSIVDERSAGFFALGIAQVTRHTVAVVCTSGSALLNLGPALAEAKYQRLPLLVISADRPAEWLDQGESQTIDQAGIFSNIVRKSFNLVQDLDGEDNLWFHNRQVAEAVDATLRPDFGPVHINTSFGEPLYEVTLRREKSPVISLELETKTQLPAEVLSSLCREWNNYQKVLVIIGMSNPDVKLQTALQKLAGKGIVVLTESTSNLHGDEFFSCIDRIIIPHGNSLALKMSPELVITAGGPLISRRIKDYLRKSAVVEHWHVDRLQPRIDPIRKLTKAICMDAADFFNHLTGERRKAGAYLDAWKKIDIKTTKGHRSFLSKAPFSDLKAFELVLGSIPSNAQLQIGNSSAIRYAQLFENGRKSLTFSNRGTSGIEGSVSTAVGASQVYRGTTFLIAGDLSVFYDGNAFWNKYTGPALKIIVFNNGGGGIFRIIEGPASVPKFEDFIETKHNKNFSDFCRYHGLAYYYMQDTESFAQVWKKFISPQKTAAMLEIDTRKVKNDEIIKAYFDNLKAAK